jgi:hypothetical protein
MHCKDCIYYKKDGNHQIWDEDYQKVIRKIEVGKCLNPKIRYNHKIQDDDELIYHDSEDYSAYLYVGKFFGCVHFKEPSHSNASS